MSIDKHAKMTMRLAFFAILLSGCGGTSSPSGLDIFKQDIEAMDGPILLGTFNDLPVRIQHDDVYAESKTLYAYVNLGTPVSSSSLSSYSGEYIVFYMEENTGEYQNDGVNFTFSSTVDYETGETTDLSNVTNVTGVPSSTQTEEAQAFVDFVALEGFRFITTVENANDETESTIVNRLKNAGYTFSTYDKESHDYFANQMNSQYDVTVEVVKLYQGYINQTERFTQIIVFKTVEQATQIYYARSANENEMGYYYRAKTVFVYTASLQTYQLLSETVIIV